MKYGWQPHLFYSFRGYKAGVIRFGCDVMNSITNTADFSISLRDYNVKHGEYRDGPVVIFRPDGVVTAAGREVLRIPSGKWVKIDILVNLSDQAVMTPAPGKYRLVITVTGEKEQVFENLPCASPEFTNVSWFGFSFGGKPGGVYYVDNLSLAPASL